MEAHTNNNEGFLDTCTCYGGAGVFTLIFTIVALGFLLGIIIFG